MWETGKAYFKAYISLFLIYQHISWRPEIRHVRAPYLSVLLNVKHAADTAWEVFLLCFILFPRHYILTLTFGCDKRKALNPTHIHSEFHLLDSNSTPTLQHTVKLLRSPRTMLGFRPHAWTFFSFPIASICNANDWMSVFISGREGLHFGYTALSTDLYFFLKMRRQHIWNCIKAPDVKRISAERRMLHNLGTESKDHLQHIFMVVLLDVRCAGKHSAVFIIWAAAVGQLLSLSQMCVLISLQVQVPL